MAYKRKYLITGCSGFVERHFIELLINRAIHSEIIGVDIAEPLFTIKESEYVKIKFIR
jgi:nucleoside-diphosphate-sugar epimerase